MIEQATTRTSVPADDDPTSIEPAFGITSNATGSFEHSQTEKKSAGEFQNSAERKFSRFLGKFKRKPKDK